MKYLSTQSTLHWVFVVFYGLTLLQGTEAWATACDHDIDRNFSGGSGTEIDPYLISSQSDLICLSVRLTQGFRYEGTFFRQTRDIVFNEDPKTVDWDGDGDIDTNDDSGFLPIGSSSIPFSGSYNGNYKTISNLFIDRNYPRQGLFGYIKMESTIASIRNVGLVDCSITGRGSVGLIGYAYLYTNTSADTKLTITNCYATGTITGDDNVGLIGNAYVATISSADASLTIDNCYATGTVTGNSMVGGLIGYIEANVINNSEGTTSLMINNCHASVIISGVHKAGGLIGQLRTSGGRVTMSDCYTTGTVLVSDSYYSSDAGGLIGRVLAANSGPLPYGTGASFLLNNSYSTVDVSGNHYLGGLIGRYEPTYSVLATINNCYAAGEVSGDYRVGGLIGYTRINGLSLQGEWDMPYARSYATISNCYAAGSVSGLSDYLGGQVGGLIGSLTLFSDWFHQSVIASLTISKCYAAGNVTGTSYNVGGLVGFIDVEENASLTTTSCYFDTDTTGLTQGVGSNSEASGVVGLTTNQFQDTSSFPSWVFMDSPDDENPWVMELDGRPLLYYQLEPINDSFSILPSILLLLSAQKESSPQSSDAS